MSSDPYEEGLRAGYAHGYDVGLAHGRAEREIEHVPDMPGRFDGPSRDELIARGHIPIDRSRPPALPVRLWSREDWAKADHRDLPTTDAGRAAWREAIAAGRVPAYLAEAYAAVAEVDLDTAAARGVADADRALATLRAGLAPAPAAAPPVEDLEPYNREHGIGR